MTWASAFPRAVFLLAALSLLWSALPRDASAQDATPLTGVLRNGTSDAEFSPESVPVTLRVLEGVVEMENRTVIPRFDGQFEFSGIAALPARTYFLTAEHQGAIYSASFRAAQLGEPLVLTVYDATNSSESLVVTSHTLIVTGADADQRIVEVLERVNVANRGGRTLVADLSAPGMPNLLRFALPPEAHNLEVRSDLVGGEVLEVDRGFALTVPVPPTDDSGHRFEFIYRVPYEAATLDLSRTLRFGADAFRVVVRADAAVAASPQLADLGTATVNDRNLQLLEGTGLPKGTRLELRLTGLPEPTLFSRLQGYAARWYLTAGVPGLAALVLGSILAATLLRRRRREPAAPDHDPGLLRQALFRQIAELDTQFDSHAISRRRYGLRRQGLKRQLLELDLQHHLEELTPSEGPEGAVERPPASQ